MLALANAKLRQMTVFAAGTGKIKKKYMKRKRRRGSSSRVSPKGCLRPSTHSLA